MAGGRTSKYTPETVEAVMTVIRAGGSIKDACDYAQISYSTYERWGHARDDFADAIKKAGADCKVAKLARIEQAGRAGTWQADAWYLERRFPDEFGQKYTIRVRPEQAAILARLGISADEAFEQMLQEAARQLHEQSSD